MTFSPRILTILLKITLLAAVFTGCATSVSFNVQRPPTWNTLGIRRIAVMPFTTSDNSALQRQAATWLTNESFQRIQATNHFTLVNAAEIQRIRAAGGNIENITEALFSGQILSLSAQDTSSQHQRRNRDGTVTNFTLYHREVRMSFSYNLSRTDRGLDIIGSNTRRDITQSDTNENWANLRSAESLVQELVQRDMAVIGRYVAPFMMIERRRLEREPSRDRTIRQLAKDAEALVKAGNYRNAQDAFLAIYRSTGSFAAGFNTGLLMEVQGDLEEAAAFMQRLHSETGNPRALTEVARLRRAIDDAGLLGAFVVNQSQRDRVIALMVDTLPPRMPVNPRVALINNTQNERDLAEQVIIGITDSFLARNITVVDRGSRTLVELERNYQLLGHVRDDEMVSIGQEAGVNTFILVAITGSGATRRLSVRMIDVERNTILYQSPNTDEMNL